MITTKHPPDTKIPNPWSTINPRVEQVTNGVAPLQARKEPSQSSRNTPQLRQSIVRLYLGDNGGLAPTEV
jgi:hypothetical protein